MRSQFDNLKVLDAVVMAVAILVMHVFGGQQRSTEMALHHDTMLSTALVLDLNLSIGRSTRAPAGRKLHRNVGQLDFREAIPGAVLRGAEPVRTDVVIGAAALALENLTGELVDASPFNAALVSTEALLLERDRKRGPTL